MCYLLYVYIRGARKRKPAAASLGRMYLTLLEWSRVEPRLGVVCIAASGFGLLECGMEQSELGWKG